MKAGSDIIFIGSISALSRKPGSSVYVGAKSGITAFSAALRAEQSEKRHQGLLDRTRAHRR